MYKRILALLVSLLSLGCTFASAEDNLPDLTSFEVRWLDASLPTTELVKRYHLDVQLHVDEKFKAGSPISMGWDDDEEVCQLVISTRDRHDSTKTSKSAKLIDAVIDPEIYEITIESIFAHEIAHCWRYKTDTIKQLPRGYTEIVTDEELDLIFGEAISGRVQKLRIIQREEALADLVSLAWVALRHPAQYQRFYTWLTFFRVNGALAEDDAVHDTRKWLLLAKDPAVFGTSEDVMKNAHTVWLKAFQKKQK